jgi:predicted dehydrogenase
MPEARSLTRDLGGIASTRDAAQAVTAEAPAHGAQLVIHENFRFQPWYRAIRKALNGGQIGQVPQATFRLRPCDGQGRRACLDRQPCFRRMERLLVHETGVQSIDTFRFLLGDPIAVYADLRRINTEIAGEDAGYILFDYPDGVRALLDGAPLENSASDYLRVLEIEEAIYRSATESRKLTLEPTP